MKNCCRNWQLCQNNTECDTCMQNEYRIEKELEKEPIDWYNVNKEILKWIDVVIIPACLFTVIIIITYTSFCIEQRKIEVIEKSNADTTTKTLILD